MRMVAADLELSMEGRWYRKLSMEDRWYRKFNYILRNCGVPTLAHSVVNFKVRHPIFDVEEVLHSEVFKSAEGDEDVPS